MVAALGMSAKPAVEWVTFFPGSDIYELEGHSALRFVDPDRHVDVVVTYGQYDFDKPGFVYRFVKGETDYMVGVYPWSLFSHSYIRQGRRIVSHTLDLDLAATARLEELIADNLRPENVEYRYNYVKDNCATRPLRLVELALGDTIMLEPTFEGRQDSREVTFRDVMRYYHRNYPWYQFGIDLALGSGIDYPISAREEAFAPVVLAGQLASATVGGRQLVSKTEVIYDAAPDAVVEAPTPWLLTPMAVGWGVFIIALIVCVRDLRRRRVTRWFTSTYYTVASLAGLLITFLVVISVHEATSPNWLLLWLNPLCLIPAIFIWLKKFKRVVYSYQIANFVVLIAGLALWPLTGQSANWAFLPLVLTDMMLSASYLRINR